MGMAAFIYLNTIKKLISLKNRSTFLTHPEKQEQISVVKKKNTLYLTSRVYFYYYYIFFVLSLTHSRHSVQQCDYAMRSVSTEIQTQINGNMKILCAMLYLEIGDKKVKSVIHNKNKPCIV